MIDKIKMVESKVLDFMDQEVGKYGNSRMDVKQIGELADVVKDLAMAEYYCSVSQSMNEGQDYNMGYGMGYGSGGGMGGGGRGDSGGGRIGYGSGSSTSGGVMGHSDPVSVIRDMMMTADPETKMRIRNELSMM